MDRLSEFGISNIGNQCKSSPSHLILDPSIKAKIVASLILVFIVFISSAQCNFKPIGHRGGSSYYYPENTLVSLEQGFLEDIYAAEIDIRFTSDSILVLMHDSYIDRTTSGSGDVKNLTLAELKKLDAGSWKSPEFIGTPVPTLKEALEMANKYQKKLYLNMKVFAPELIARTLSEANVSPDIVILDPDDLEKVEAYHQILPNTPLAYFGELPQEIDDPSFYSFLKNNGVIAIEIPADYIRYSTDDTFIKLRNMAHSYNLELWAYTVNDAAYFNTLKDFGIDALETDRPSEAYQVFCNNSFGGHFPEKQITGQWDFDKNLNGTIGSKLVLMGDTTVQEQKIKFGTTQSFGVSPIENTSVNIARIPAFDSQHALRFFSNIAPEGIPGVLDCDNTYSLVFDLLKPSGKKVYTAILQTSNNNSNDGDFFLNGSNNSFGILEQYKGGFKDSTWVRLALVFDLYNEKLETYLDGNYVATIALEDSQDGRFCLNNNWGVQASNFFSDEDGETNPIFVSSIQLRNYAMTPDEIKWLGKPKAAKIDMAILPEGNLVCPDFKEDIKLTGEGNAILLLADAGDKVNYKWEINSGSGWEMITGTAFKTPASSGLGITRNPELLNGYKFRCIAFNDCQTVSNEYLFNYTANSNQIKDSQKGLFLMYPNPSKETVTIDFLQSEGKYDIAIYTVMGIEVYKRHSIAGKWQIDLRKGSYLVHVRNTQKSEIKKLIITE